MKRRWIVPTGAGGYRIEAIRGQVSIVIDGDSLEPLKAEHACYVGLALLEASAVAGRQKATIDAASFARARVANEKKRRASTPRRSKR